MLINASVQSMDGVDLQLYEGRVQGHGSITDSAPLCSVSNLIYTSLSALRTSVGLLLDRRSSNVLRGHGVMSFMKSARCVKSFRQHYCKHYSLILYCRPGGRGKRGG